MNKIINFIKPFAGILAVILIAIFFGEILMYFVIAAVLSMLGCPVCKRFKNIHIKSHYLNSSVAAVLTLLMMIGLLLGFFAILIPIFNNEANIFSNINTKAIVDYYREPLAAIYNFLGRFNLITSYEETVAFVESEINSLINWTNFSNLFSSVMSTTGSIFIATFSIIFLTFFFLRDSNIIPSILLAITPDGHEGKMRIIIKESRELLTRYLFGLLTEIGSMMILLSGGLYIFGIKDAIVIAFIGCMLNVIPYLGPILGGTIGVVLGVISVFSIGNYDMLTHDVIIIISVFLGANLIDNFVLQPLIYSKSVKAHPVEIFLVILMAGSTAGILGMIIAIPTYTLIRIVAKQFLSEFKLVELLTRNID